MTIIMGLGNPGEKFNHTRHNAGFMALDLFAKEHNFPEFKASKKYHSLISEHDDIILAKPQTFMNDSGKAAASLLKNAPENTFIVIHDDIDLPLGKMKFSKDSGAGGHKGVDSIIQHLGNNNFMRLKIGIGQEGEKVKALEVVLKKFTPAEQKALDNIIEKSTKALSFLIENGLEKTMNEYN